MTTSLVYPSNDHSLSSFHSETSPVPKIAPVVAGGLVFVGKAVAGGAIGAAASWATTRILDNKFPQSSTRKL